MSVLTVFFERSGEDAKEVLAAFREALEGVEACQTATLLESAQQINLYLLVTTWAGEDEMPAAPEGTKQWIFRAEDGS